MRLFCGVTPPPSWIEVLTDLRAILERRHGDALRWTAPALFHLTVRFIGEVDEAAAAPLLQMWPGIILPPEPLVLELSSCGCFPNEGPERVVWAGAQACRGSWGGLVAYTDAILANVGLARPPSEPVAHITIGRVRRLGEVRGLRAELEAISLHAEPFTVRSVGLFASAPTPTGSQYSLLATTSGETSRQLP